MAVLGPAVLGPAVWGLLCWCSLCGACCVGADDELSWWSFKNNGLILHAERQSFVMPQKPKLKIPSKKPPKKLPKKWPEKMAKVAETAVPFSDEDPDQAPLRQSRSSAILNAAEKLFAIHGFDGVSLRQVARAASVDLALPSYYFKNKRGLFDAVLLRRAQIINGWRLEALAIAEQAAAPSPPTIEAILGAFLKPLLCRPAGDLDEGWRHYYALIAFVNSAPDWGGRLMSHYFDPLVRRFMAAFEKTLPESKKTDLYWCYHFLSGALTLSLAQTGRIDYLSDGQCLSADLCGACERMIPFMAAGFRTLCLAEEKNSPIFL